MSPSDLKVLSVGKDEVELSWKVMCAFYSHKSVPVLAPPPPPPSEKKCYLTRDQKIPVFGVWRKLPVSTSRPLFTPEKRLGYRVAR